MQRTYWMVSIYLIALETVETEIVLVMVCVTQKHSNVSASTVGQEML